MRMTAVAASDASTRDGSLVCDFRLPCKGIITARLHDPDMSAQGRYPLRRGDHCRIEIEHNEIHDWDAWSVDPIAPAIPASAAARP